MLKMKTNKMLKNRHLNFNIWEKVSVPDNEYEPYRKVTASITPLEINYQL